MGVALVEDVAVHAVPLALDALHDVVARLVGLADFGPFGDGLQRARHGCALGVDLGVLGVYPPTLQPLPPCGEHRGLRRDFGLAVGHPPRAEEWLVVHALASVNRYSYLSRRPLAWLARRSRAAESRAALA